MADPRHHVPFEQTSPSGIPVFGENHEPYGYNTGSFQNEQGQNVNFDGNWSLVDPGLAQHHGTPYGNPGLAPNWAPTSTPTPPQNNAFAPGNIYSQHFSSVPPFQNLNYSAHQTPTYSQSLDPALIAPSQKLSLDQAMTGPAPTSNANTISPAALQANSSKPHDTKGQPPSNIPFVPPKQQVHPMVVVPQVTIPKAKPSADGKFMVIDFDDLDRAVPSKRLHKFLSVGQVPQDLPITKSTIPQYTPRKSMNELRKLAVSDPKLAGKLGKRVTKSSRPGTGKVGRPPKAAASAASPETRSTPSESSSDYESSDSGSEYESELEEEVPDPSPLPPARPSEPLQAVRYDTMKAVWLARNVPAQAEQIRSGLKDFWEVVKTIRDRWKSDSDAVKKATEAKKESEIPLLKDRVKSQRDMMEMALRSALEYGHPDVVRLFGENKPLMFLFYQFLAERIGEKEYSTAFVKIALKLLTQCSTLTVTVLDETKLNKALLRFVKNGDDEVKGLAQKVTEQATLNSKSKIELAKTAKPVDVKKEDARAKSGSPQKAAVAAVAGVKRSLGVEAANGQPAKRVASSSVNAPSSATSVKSAVVQKKALAAGAEKTSAGVSAATASKPNTLSKTPSTNFFSSLPAHKKPPTSGNGAATAKKPVTTSVKVEKKVTAAPKTTFSFAETMANLSKVQEPEPFVKEEEERPDESPEEKAKRLRKEERRKLRVSWKPDAVLVSVRVFHHDPEEELGHDANSVRDVGDLNSEGRMFKQHRDAMDIDEDDDDQPKVQDYGQWRTPSDMDYSQLPDDSRANNYKRFGGDKTPDSPETGAMQQYVNRQLLAFYQTSADVPACPTEPLDPYNGIRLETKTVGPPGPESVYTQRVAAIAKPAVDVSAILQGLTPFLNQMSSPPVQTSTPATAAPPQVPPANDQYAALTNFFAQHSAQPQQQAPPQAPMGAQQPFQAPLPALAANPQLNAILAAFQPQSQQPQAPSQPAPTAPPMFYPPAPAPGAAPVPDLTAVFAQLGNNPQLLSMFTQNQQPVPNAAPPPQPQPSNTNTSTNAGGYYEHPDRKRRREQDDHHDHKPRKSKSKYRTVPCAFYKKGMCKKGDECTYLHEN